MLYRILPLIFSVLLFATSCSSTKVDVSKKEEAIVAMQEREEEPLIPHSPVKEEKELIILDAGHGGSDSGAKVPTLEEKEVALLTTMLVGKYLDRMGYKVIFTRSDDTFIHPKERACLANQMKADLFVSIHFNAANSRVAKGVEVYYFDGKDNKRTRSSRLLANDILSHILSETKAQSRGVKSGRFCVIRETSMPAVLVEGGFITNLEERAQLKDLRYIRRLAKGIAEGIDQYVH